MEVDKLLEKQINKIDRQDTYAYVVILTRMGKLQRGTKSSDDTIFREHIQSCLQDLGHH